MTRYAIWDKTSPVITPIGEVLTAEKWMERYPVAALENITVVCSAGEINGGFFGTIGQMKQHYEAQGCDFSACTSNEEILQTIEDFEDSQNAVDETAVSNEELTATSLASIAASLEYQNMMTLDDVDTTEEV